MPQTTVDARGLLCPQPLIMVKKALKNLAVGESMTALIDNETSRQNVERFLKDNGADTVITESNGIFTLTITKKKPELARPDAESYCAAAPGNPHAICINARTMGAGNDDLGQILMKAFVNTIKDAAPLPGTIVFYNGGIFLALTDSPVLDALRNLAQSGVRILVCGTCLDFYKKKAELGVGTVSNMYEITQALSSAGHVIYP